MVLSRIVDFGMRISDCGIRDVRIRNPKFAIRQLNGRVAEWQTLRT